MSEESIKKYTRVFGVWEDGLDLGNRFRILIRTLYWLDLHKVENKENPSKIIQSPRIPTLIIIKRNSQKAKNSKIPSETATSETITNTNSKKTT